MHGEDQDDFPVPWPYRGQSKLREAMASRASNSLLSGFEVLEKSSVHPQPKAAGFNVVRVPDPASSIQHFH